MNIDIYTDGSADKHGNGGWAFVLVFENKIFGENRGREFNTTNNRMELQAVIECLRYVIEINDLTPSNHFTIYSDSMYAIRWFNKINKIKLINKNFDKLLILKVLKEEIPNCEIKWIKSHSNDTFNSRADKLAKQARKGVICTA